MIRSLRWRLVVATALIIAMVVAAAGVFSRFAVIREFDRYLVTQRGGDTRQASAALRAAGPARFAETFHRVHAETKLRMIVTNDDRRVIARLPPELAQYDVTILPNGTMKLTRNEGGRFEELFIQGARTRIEGVGTVWFLPGKDTGAGQFRVSVDRWLIGGLALAALLAVLVIVTIFRRVFAPVEALTRGARALAGGRLDTRVAVRGSDEIGELATAFNAMADALERNERARRNMVNDVAHELRTPLTNIRVQVEAVQDGVIEADPKFFASIEEDAATLSRLVDDLQQLSLGEAGQLRLEREDVGVEELVARALDGLQRRIEERGLSITTDVVPAMVHADPRRIVQVLRNLLVNALTYARSSLVIASVVHDAHVELRVTDDGEGVAPEHAERIFDRFYRADAARSRTTGGAGLGLAIARQLVELHGGTIHLENHPGAGASFVFTIPRA
jgi:signal transduction histidine kinase